VEQGDFEDPDFRDDPSLVGNNRTDPTTRLTLSKRLSRQVEFTISQNLRESGNTTFIISYYVTPTIEIRALSRDDDTASLGIRHQVTFGGGVGRTPTELRVKPKVSAITFAGVEPAIEREVRDEISLDPGDNFDFLVLQRDVDRVRDRFKAQGYFEARVRTRRVEAPDSGTVTVEYTVDRGPRTVLAIVGTTLPSSLIAELEEAWHRSAFDQFLIDDLTHRVRRYLVGTNELGSVVVGTVDRSVPGTKRLTIEVTEGVRVSGREIRVTGHQALDGDDLLDAIAAQGLDVDGWLDRKPLEELVVTAYQAAGFLKAEVTGGPLTIDGDIGVLPVTIVEGPQAQVTSVQFTGVPDSRLAAIQAVAAMPPPAPYLATEVSAARVRIEEQYRRDGFNAADVEVLPEVAADDTVRLTFTISEGPQQVLQDVQMSGIEITNGNVLTDALRFELGKPVDLDEWAVARKRLYDTNVFRLVDIQPVPVGEAVDGVQPVTARVVVQEYPQWAFRYGFQLEGNRELELDEFTSTRNAGVVAELKNPNLFGRALTFGAFGMYQYDRQDATLFLATSRLFGWRARSSLYGFYSRDHIRDDAGQDVLAINDVQGFSADQRWRTHGLQIVYGYRFERSHTFDPEPLPNDPFPLDFVSNLATLSTAALWDRRDDPLSPATGTFSSASIDHAASWLGSDVNNRKLLLQQYAFVPWRSVVLASRVQWGKKFGPDALLPDDRFQAGGATSVRGYGEDSLGPRAFDGLPLGGEGLLVLNQEIRFPIRGWINGVSFIDAGRIQCAPDNVECATDAAGWNSLKVGYGVGLRFVTPVGMFRVDFGIPGSALPTATAREPNSLKGGRWYFGIGHIF
jgi:outer membrane protein assembly factor BamA